MVKHILNKVDPVDNRKNFISCYTKIPNESTNLPTETGQLSTKKTYITKEILSSTKLSTNTDRLITKNTDK